MLYVYTLYHKVLPCMVSMDSIPKLGCAPLWGLPYMYIRVYMCIYMYVCVYIYIYIYICQIK